MARDGAGTYTRTHADYIYGEVIDQVAVNAELNDIATALTGSLTGKFWWGGTAGGTADARTITPSPSISAYAAGQEWVFINGGAANATATPTLAISGLAPRTGKRADGSALVPGDWPANALIRLIDDGTNLRLAERMGGSFTGSIIQAEGAAVASAATTDIWANDGDTVHITGTTTITSFGTAVQAGQWKKVIFDGALTLTHGANLSLPGSANITTAADDMAFVYADTTTQFDVVYFKKSGLPTVAAVDTNGLVLLQTVTASASATADITAFSATYDDYIIIAEGIRPATDGQSLLCRLRFSGGFISTSTYYYHTNASVVSAATYAGVAAAAAAAIVILDSGLDNANAASTAGFVMHVNNVNSTSLAKAVHWTGYGLDLASNIYKTSFGFGFESSTVGNAITGIQFLHGAGNMTVGTFRLYGVNKT